MWSKTWFIAWMMLCWLQNVMAVTIDQEASNPNFVHAYILSITPGKNFYSAYGHEAIRMVCPSKKLDYCFSFEMNMSKSSYTDFLTRKAKSGFIMWPTSQFLNNYKKEGRGITAYEVNLLPKEKQELWRFLDKSVASGPTWTFDYISVNCMTMVLYAISSAIMPSQIEYKQLPPITKASLSEWEDYVSRKSPWVNLLLHATLIGVKDEEVDAEDRFSPEMTSEIMLHTIITDSTGVERSMMKGKPIILLPTLYEDKPIGFRPWMAGCLLAVIIGGSITFIINKKKKKRCRKTS